MNSDNIFGFLMFLVYAIVFTFLMNKVINKMTEDCDAEK